MPNNPFRGFMDSVHESNRARQQWLMGSPDPSQVQQPYSVQADAWTPELEVILEDSNLLILVDLPGVTAEDIEIALSDGTLTIYGERRGHRSGGERHLHERRTGIFRRSLTLPSKVSENGISSNLEDGVLEITVEDYASVSEPRRIQVNSNQRRTQ